MTTFEQWSLLAAYLNLIAAFGGLGLIYHGIRVVAKGAEMRVMDSERKHNEAMTESEQKHNESMASLRELIKENAESRASLRELIEGQAESRMALRELIERTR